ncbi:MAG: LysR family transcriptional regulator, partial [Labilithrix sp.]|nr:LysR family transcriptional regulator [Labilithrix sp.]
LLAAHPELRVELSLSDRMVNLAEEGFDCAVRIGPLDDSSLIGVRLGEVAAVVCAAPGYFAARGTPGAPHDLAVHDCIHLSSIPLAREWRFRGEGGREFSIPVSGRFALNNGVAVASAAIAGAGLARVPLFLVEDALARGELVEVLGDWKMKPTPLYVVYPSTPQVAPKLRVFIDLMRDTSTLGRAAEARTPKRRRAP